jgi:O-acetyl-ADP-ribose deacetylase (regulator of RNase III)
MIEAGYRTTTMTIENTVKNCFRALAALPPADAVSSILFPIFGAGTGQLSVDAAVRALLDTIASEARANAGVRRIVIFAFTDLHRRVVRERAEAMGLALVS